jgi:3' terminal RNA ribose 2'-O-methyltransferase Hen1
MVLTISTTHRPATDLGFLLHKNPERVHSTDLGFGNAHVVYSEVSDDRCTAVLVLEIDPVALVRGSSRFDQYVNDRPYAASSFLSVAMGRVFGTAMTGRSKERQELADAALPLEARIPVLPCRGGESFLRRLFEPLGYEVSAAAIPLDEKFPEWGISSYLDVTLRYTGRVRDLLNHLFVLIPVLDDDKHYWVAKDEIEKLLRKGENWLETHPEKTEIVRRYLMRQRNLTREALERLTIVDDDPDPDSREARDAAVEEAVERPLSLHEQRLNTVLETLKSSGARSVLDLGCGEGKLLQLLLKDKQFETVVGMDVSLSVLNRAESRLRVDRLPPMVAKRLRLIHGSLVYRDRRIEGFDAAALIEVIEHLDLARLVALERNLLEFARPRMVVITTPNREYNVLFEGLKVVDPQIGSGKMRHRDHRFEWTRAEFQEWGQRVASQFGYEVAFVPIGPVDETYGAPSQMAVFSRGDR